MLDDLFLPYEHTVEIREKGFDEPCCRLFNSRKEYSDIGDPADIKNKIECFTEFNWVPAPMIDQVINWIVKNYSISIETTFCNTTNFYGWNWMAVYLGKERPIPADFGSMYGAFKTRREAQLWGIERVTKTLVPIAKK